MRALIVFMCLIFLAGCAHQSNRLEPIAPGNVVVFIPQAYAARANLEGHQLIKPEWEAAMVGNLASAIVNHLSDTPRFVFVPQNETSFHDAASEAATHWLYETYGKDEGAPTQDDTVQSLTLTSPETGLERAQYGLQIYARSIYADTANRAAQLLVGALLLAPGRPYGGDRFVSAVLFSLDSGEVLWSDQQAVGDIRNTKAANTAVKTLLAPLFEEAQTQAN